MTTATTVITDYVDRPQFARRADPCPTPGWLAPGRELDQEDWQDRFIDPCLALVMSGAPRAAWPTEPGASWRVELLAWMLTNEPEVPPEWRARAVVLAENEASRAELLHFVEGLYKSITLRPWEAMTLSLTLLQDLLSAYPGCTAVREALAEYCFYYGLYRESAQLYAGCDGAIAGERLHAFEAFLEAAQAPAEKKGSVLVLSHGDQDELLAACLREVREKSAFGDQLEVLVGLNGSGPRSIDVARQFGAAEIICSRDNVGIELYKALFARARGACLFELDDDVIELPGGFDETTRAFFSVFDDYGFLGLNPIENAYVGRGGRPDDKYYVADERHGLVVESGPVGGWCAAIPRDLYQRINGFYGVRLSRPGRPIILGEEPQLWRKLWLRGTRFGIMRDVRCLHGVKSVAEYRRWAAAQPGAPAESANAAGTA